MALTKTKLCNLALSKIGNESLQLADFDTDTGKAKDQCDLHYEQTLHEVIRSHSWNCTKQRAQLIEVDPYSDFGWSHEFELPANCIRPLFLSNSDSTEINDKYGVEWIVEGRRIKTNSSLAYLLYIKEPDPADMDALFAQAFYTLLASKLAVPLIGDHSLENNLIMNYLNVILPEARRVNSFEGKTEPVVDSDWLDATYSSGLPYRPFSQADYGSFSF